jgi:ferric-dicitrate binding protein FerR (iron transport regulator)
VPNISDISLDRIRPLAVVSAALLLSVGVCLSQVQAPLAPAQPSLGNAAKLIQMTGQVSVYRGNASFALNFGDLVSPSQIVVTGPDGSATFQVADGSTIEVYPNSRFVFRETTGNWEELLHMIIGRVRVEIQHLGGHPNPNKVRTATAVISVRGTIFDVEVEDNDGTTLVAVEEGKVEVRHLLQTGSRLLNPGEWVEVFWNQPLAVRKTDYGVFWQRALNVVKDTLYEAVIHNRTGVPAGTPGTSGGGTAADKSGKTPPSDGTNSPGTSAPPAPPPAPPAPPH